MTNSLELEGRQLMLEVSILIFAVDDTTLSNGVSDVVILDSGYGYDSFPIGDKGGSGRVWADRCQTSVHRANFDWDVPYTEGQTITLFYGDTITLPVKIL